MEVNNKYQRVNEIVNAVTGTVSGSISGMLAGGLATGHPAGAIVGGIAGGMASLGGGIADIYINDKLRAEALDDTKDQFGYNLGNIQALPITFAKLSSLGYV